jgi:hypothetical protein
MKKKNKIVVVCGKHKFEVEVGKGQTLTIWKLGDPKRGWIPSKKHFDAFRNALVFALKDPVNNHILFHYGVSVEQVKL